MNDPLNPLENQGSPFNHEGPLGDPFLDALERSIEKPPGFTDPLAESDGLLMDDLAEQLDAVEASIENSTPLPGPDAFGGNTQDMAEDEQIPLEDSDESFEDTKDSEGETDSPPLLFSQNPSTLTATPSQSTPRLHKRESRNSSRYRDGLQFKHRSSRGGGRARTGISRTARVCPESHEPADEQKCESCEKYRHWPEGTDEEPHECWYDWQAGYQCNQSDIESDE